MRIVISLVSIIVAIAFAAFGSVLLRASDGEPLIRGYGLFSIFYGLASAATLAVAWVRPFRRLPIVAGALAVSVIAMFLIGSLDVAMISGLEVASMIIAGLAASVNWYAVYFLVRIAEQPRAE